MSKLCVREGGREGGRRGEGGGKEGGREGGKEHAKNLKCVHMVYITIQEHIKTS